ncbi:MAG TPA: CBS domain-containing protein [Candidatus Binatia bacterium]|nr:CBS domain-containing protein [Candidatus Binatia bacterium]
MNIKDIMTNEPACAARDDDLRRIAVMMVEHDCGEIPICDDAHKPIGVVTDRDITCRLVAKGKNPLEMKAADCMSSPVVTVSPDMAVEDASRLMEQYQLRRLPVVDGDGRLCGMVAQADIVKKGPSQIAVEVVPRVSEPNVMASAAGGVR